MVDFGSLRRTATRGAPTDPIEIFKRLPKPSHINDLWDSQSSVLKLWQARRTERDVVIKLNTGGGKTLVGLLIAQSLMIEHGLGALYLCPTNQLVRQTVDKAIETGLAAQAYETGVPLPKDFLN